MFLNLERVVSKALFSHRLAVQNLGRTSCRTVLLKTSYTPSTCFGGVPVPKSCNWLRTPHLSDGKPSSCRTYNSMNTTVEGYNCRKLKPSWSISSLATVYGRYIDNEGLCTKL